ncbi:MAG: 2-amino-4-hydroxy-6-hydroxymethyldihydropteridine diphosphokinase [Acidobacteria bacterium]|nr:2-amino-4-hydroxy-6-hydroxymethyldihydropteridine diphosphokinase [Acidobacteriota bacterium]MYF14211.1 2-amino-4-hydroxy-6-hydroxymethyldihydropteridine diphosphokinase [Acidobacteriota bacterium]MYI96214.1 2-amino-4-hydroxy-6-hydroxymethyldihydropteridine diphosphokinase [Acidobacteriota bacterium]
MSPEEAVLRRLRAEIENELGRLAQLRVDAAGAPRTIDSYSVRARGSILHDLYTGVEHVFTRMAEELDGGLPRGDAWHSQLLRSMTLEISGVRPRVVTPTWGGDSATSWVSDTSSGPSTVMNSISSEFPFWKRACRKPSTTSRRRFARSWTG